MLKRNVSVAVAAALALAWPPVVPARHPPLLPAKQFPARPSPARLLPVKPLLHRLPAISMSIRTSPSFPVRMAPAPAALSSS